jgi:ribosome-associated toxin RatA of RatAB toxin-antitoxin module
MDKATSDLVERVAAELFQMVEEVEKEQLFTKWEVAQHVLELAENAQSQPRTAGDPRIDVTILLTLAHRLALSARFDVRA